MNQLNSAQLKDFPQNLIFHQRARSNQARAIYITFSEESIQAQYDEEEQAQLPQKSQNESSSDEENKVLEEQALLQNRERLDSPESAEIKLKKVDLIGEGDELYEEDFYGGNEKISKQLSQENTLLVVTKEEFVNSNADSSRIILSDESLDEILTNLDLEASQHSPFKDSTHSHELETVKPGNEDFDLSSEDLIEAAVNKEANQQLHDSFQLDQSINSEKKQQNEKQVVYEFQSPENKQIQTKQFVPAKRNKRSTDDILSLDAKNYVPDNVQGMSFLQMKNKFLHKRNKQQLQDNSICVVGREQSPINIYPDEQFYCEPNALKINFLHQLYEKQIKLQNDPDKKCLKLYGANFGIVNYGEHSFQVPEILIKSPSEHTLGKEANPMDVEAQIVCEDKFGLKLIISVFFQSLGEEYDQTNQ